MEAQGKVTKYAWIACTVACVRMKLTDYLIFSWLFMTTITRPSAVRLTIRTSLRLTEG